MKTWTAFSTLGGKSPAEALGEALETLEPAPTGVGVIEIEDGTGRFEVGGYFSETPDQIALALLAAVHGAEDFVISEVPETDWVGHVRRELVPVEAGRFFVYGSHDADKVPEGRVALLIEAAMAFGTGHHGTTLGCLRAIDGLVDAGEVPRRIADIGSGTGVLAMAAASVWDAKVVASDIDPVAIDVARANVEANGMTDNINIVEAEGLNHPKLVGPFDLILANILKGPLIELAPEFANATRVGSTVVLSGILLEQADTVANHYACEGFNISKREDIVDWSTLTLTRNELNF